MMEVSFASISVWRRDSFAFFASLSNEMTIYSILKSITAKGGHGENARTEHRGQNTSSPHSSSSPHRSLRRLQILRN